ncbi:MAG TPA: response regulator [Fibrobacteria bacterium]|nr:response regulator [Fibrobacteria bacterium]
MRILIVDDSVSMRRVERSMLTDMGFSDIKEAADGSEALKMVSSGKFDLILLDWKMPVLSGLDTLKRLKASPDFKSIPVVMVTSESNKTKILEAIQSGAANYIIKPFSDEVLKEKLEPFLGKETA